MKRQHSLYILFGTVALISLLFYQVIQPYIVSLLFATVLAVLFKPAQKWIRKRLGNHNRLSAIVTTTAVLLLILLPLVGVLILAATQMADVAGDVVSLLQDGEESQLEEELEELEESQLAKRINRFYFDLSIAHQKRIDKLVSQAGEGFMKRVYEKTASFLGDLVSFIIGFFITGLALYYMLADGDSFLRQAKDFTPLEVEEQDLLVEQFGVVCRAVVLGTVAAALVQAILAGIGFLVVGLPNVILLSTVTMFFAFIPFLGGSFVVILISIWLALEGRYLAAGGLFIYCLFIISLSDNLIRAYVIGSEAKMNPLVALITVLGAIQLVGLIGIFVGPMIAALFYTFLKLVRDRVLREQSAPAPT